MFGDIRRMRSGQLGQPWRPPLHSNRLRHGRRWQMTKLSEIGGRRLPFLRWAREMPPDARLYSVEFAEANAAIARRIWDHAGVTDRITAVVGSIGDGGGTLDTLEAAHGFTSGALDFLFVDHDKAAYLPDLKHILERRWLHKGSVVVADNVRVPGAPAYRAYMREMEGTGWRTVEHKTHVEYQTLIPDLVLESESLGP